LPIVQTDTEKGGTFIFYQNNIIAGELVYKWTGKTKLIIEHTEVGEKFEGMGIGKKLVLEAVQFARKNNVKILPWCPFAKSLFNKTTEIQDVLF
jgi:predicted GNAT family acetyltransferase